jgi:hypothetical protein
VFFSGFCSMEQGPANEGFTNLPHILVRAVPGTCFLDNVGAPFCKSKW